MKCTEAEGKGRVRLGISSVLEVLSVLHRKDERCMLSKYRRGCVAYK